MLYHVRCRHCPRASALVITVARLEDRQEQLLRAHVEAAHPEVAETGTLGQLLAHYFVEWSADDDR